jgi:hypothetical protein
MAGNLQAQANPCPYVDTSTKTAKCRLMVALGLPWAECHPEHYLFVEEYSTCRLKQQTDQKPAAKVNVLVLESSNNAVK